MPAAMAFADEQRRLLDPHTPEGIYNLTLSGTGNHELAEKVMIEAKVQQKLASLEGVNL